ncbi:Memo family protein [Fasciolopsis buskii]|uniref:Memo family protein n=1 Tax=Fasciolopsis buskii TaxID=27845 RepID=A0A8E0S3J3_9TREM|nr:Memo family protein [Fasciolopsis buski]
MASVRSASHAGTWYTNSATELSSQLSCWLDAAPFGSHPARAIIVPHAGYRYSGSCAAYGFKQIDSESTKRLFILGPSHHVDIGPRCALSPATVCKTPLYDLAIDTAVYDELKGSGEFSQLSLEQDEDEHSIEMQLPFIAKVMERLVSYMW